MPTCSRCRKNVTPTAEGYCPSCAEPFEEAAHRSSEPGGRVSSEKRPLGITIIAWLTLVLCVPLFPLYGIFFLADGGSAFRGDRLVSLIMLVALSAQGMLAIGLLRAWRWARWVFVACCLIAPITRFSRAGFGLDVIVMLVVFGIFLAVLSSRDASLYFDGGQAELDYRPWSGA